MNRRHLAAILWLRWRLTLHQVRRAGAVSAIILVLAGAGIASVAIGLFFLGLLGGIAGLPRLPPEGVLLVWDVVAAIFLFSWLVGLVTVLQRSEVLSLEKLLHLPISPSGAFVVNYLGSLASLSMAVLLPGMVGLAIAQVVTKGPTALLVFPLLASFLFMVTALSYQFQGWLASLMVNKRRRRTIIAVVSISLMVISQLPNLLNSRHWGHRRNDALQTRYEEDVTRLDRAREAGTITAAEHDSLQASARSRLQQARRERRQQRTEQTFLIARKANLFVPLGWLPYGAMACARGSALPALLGILGAGLIGAVSLRRSYRTTLRLYSGGFASAPARRPMAAAPAKPAPTGTGLLERQIPGVSPHAAAVALAGFRSLTRAPEVKLALLTPVILILLYGSMMMARGARFTAMRPFMALGAIGMILLSLQQLIGNQFGLDRDGFRALVLSPSPRRDILLGKNLALAPVALGLGLTLIAVVQVLFPMPIDHVLATVAELGAIYLLLCMVANLASILAPVPLASGSLRPAHPKAGVMVVRLGLVLTLPVLMGLAALPLGLELLVHHLGWLTTVPIYLLCALPELGVIAWVYGQVIAWQGNLLQSREQRILEVVTTKVE